LDGQPSDADGLGDFALRPLVALDERPGVEAGRDHRPPGVGVALVGVVPLRDRREEEVGRSRATDLFLSTVSEWDDPDERDADSRRAVVAASLYAGSLIEGDQRSQGEIAEAVGVARLTIQQRWKDLLEETGLEPPSW